MKEKCRDLVEELLSIFAVIFQFTAGSIWKKLSSVAVARVRRASDEVHLDDILLSGQIWLICRSKYQY